MLEQNEFYKNAKQISFIRVRIDEIFLYKVTEDFDKEKVYELCYNNLSNLVK